MVGAICRFSENGKKSLSLYKPNRFGVIVSVNRDNTCWIINWIGTKMRQSVNKDYIEIVKNKNMVTTKDWAALSSQVLRTNYNEEKKEMIVQFKNATWAYEGVPVEQWELSLNAPSIGKFINTNIKPKYQARKIQ